MRAINNIRNIVSTVEGYKLQFVNNNKPNILFIDVAATRYEFYNLLIPAFVLHGNESANVAFTEIQKFIEGPQRKQIQLTEFEVNWADTIVFPFSIESVHQEGKHFFDLIREIKPSVKIVFLVEPLFTHSKFYENLFKQNEIKTGVKFSKDQKQSAKKIIENSIIENIDKSDRVICSHKMVFESIQNKFPTKNIFLLQPKNYNEIIFEGLTDHLERMEYMSLNEIRVYVHFVNDGKSREKFIHEVIEKAPDHVVFYSQSNISEPNHVKLSKSTITHFYKELFTKNFDLSIIVGDYNDYDKSSSFLEGLILDCIFMHSYPIVNNSKLLPENLQKIPTLNNTQILEYFNLPFQTRFNNSKILNQIISENTVNENVLKVYEKIFL